MSRRAHAAGLLKLSFALALILTAAPVVAATISGRVLKGGGRTPLGGIPVSIHILRGNEELPGTTQPTDASGAFRFPGLQDGAGIEYYVSTEYEGAFYTEGPIQVVGGSGSHDLMVYDVGKNFDAVRVQDHHVIVERKDDGFHVTEIVIFQNDAETAYLGVGVNHATPSGMRVGLPSSIKEFKPGLGLDEPSVNLQGRELTSVRPIPPGQRPLSFTYIVPLSGRIDLSHRLYFPTRQMTVLLDDPSLAVESDQLKSGGIREQGGKKYAMYFGANLPVGSEVGVRLGGASFFSNPKIVPFLAAPFLIAAILWFAARRGRRAQEAGHAASQGHAMPPRDIVPPAAPSSTAHAAPVPAVPAAHAAPPAPRRKAAQNGDDEIAQVYLYLIAALDRGVEHGDISQEGHALLRANLKRRLETILSGPQATPR